jgi:hypothetical protein
MPALPDVPGVLRVDVQQTLGDDDAVLNRIFVNYTGTAPNDATCNTIASQLYTIWASEFIPYMTPDKSLTGVVVTDLTSPSSGQGSHSAVTPGTFSSSPIGASSCMLASIRIARRYRGGKPRTYLPVGGDTVLQTPQTWTSTFVGQIQASLNQVISDIAAYSVSGCSLGSIVNVSYYSGFTIRPSPPIPGVRARNVPTVRVAPVVDVLVAWNAETRLASQRRRDHRSP